VFTELATGFSEYH